MSLLQNEEFAIYQLRTSYLSSIHDGVGERLINVNTAFLNDPAFRAAGWNSNPPELKRTYSPPIPTAVTSEYFKAPPRSSSRADVGSGEDDDEGGMVTGAGGTEVLGPSLVARRRRRREQLEEDDSSDLSDESDEEPAETSRRPATQVRFETVTSRARAESSPLRSSSKHEGPSFLITSPSRPPTHTRLKDGSFASSKTRGRRNTTTSSEVSSENELDPSLFKRRQIQASNAKSGGTLSGQIKEDQETQPDRLDSDGEPLIEELDEDQEDDLDEDGPQEAETDDEDARSADSDDDSSLASGFSETVDSNSILEGTSTALRAPEIPGIPTGDSDTLSTTSPKKNKQPPATLPELPPPRPISTIQPISALAEAIRAKNKKPTSPFDRFATLSGRGEANPLHIKMYLPPSTEASEPLEMMLKRVTDSGATVTVGEAIGFALWRYGDEGLKPSISKTRMNVNWWTLRIVEDEEVDFDFPPLGRSRPMTDFTSNNNRPARGRGRGKAWDEFALVEATEAQFHENEKTTPEFSRQANEVQQDEQDRSPPEHKPQRPEAIRIPSETEISKSVGPRRNVVTGPPIYVTSGIRKDTATGTLDTPTTQTSHATPRSGAPKTLQIHYSDANMGQYVTPIDVTTDTYLAEVFDQVCKKLNVDKALYVLKVSRTTTIAPSDRTVEALGPERQSLDLVRRRFVGHGTFGLSGSPGSTSPNAPLFLTTSGTPKKAKKGVSSHPLAQQAEMSGGTALPAYNKKYNVVRKQPMSFTPSQQRMLALDGEYMHIMPSDTGRERLFDATQGKTTSVHFSSVVGCKINRKHPKTFRVVVFKERESKRYDFEAGSAFEAAEIVHEIKKGIEPYRDTVN